MNEEKRFSLPENADSTAITDWQAVALLPEGPLDIVGDIHGELDALEDLLECLGYQSNGTHPNGRSLVFVGDLIDRGPDSPGVVRRVADLVDRGRAQCVMGNHELNALIPKFKDENRWLFGQGAVENGERIVSTDRERNELFAFLGNLPLALHRPDLRVVHACWEDDAFAQLARVTDPINNFKQVEMRINAEVANEPDETTRKLALQNQNPIKLITSGPEARADEPFFAGDKWRNEKRTPWWDGYDRSPFTVFGHYWRIPIPAIQKDDGLFNRYPLTSTHGRDNAICIDYSVGGRYAERRQGTTHRPFLGRLAALRWPERVLVYDDGEQLPVTKPQSCDAHGS